MADIMDNIKREVVDSELEEENKVEEPTPKMEIVEEEEEEPTPKKNEDDLFEKPKKEIAVEEKKPKKKKRQLSALQLENLKKAREKSVAKRKELKEAKDIEKKARDIKKEQAREERRAKRDKQDEMIELKAQLKLEAEKQATWTEERLQGLINSSIDNYIEKKKSMKPQPREVVPPPVNPNAIGQTPLHPKYYMPNPQHYMPTQYIPQQQHTYGNQQPRSSTKDPTLSGLFGNYE